MMRCSHPVTCAIPPEAPLSVLAFQTRAPSLLSVFGMHTRNTCVSAQERASERASERERTRARKSAPVRPPARPRECASEIERRESTREQGERVESERGEGRESEKVSPEDFRELLLDSMSPCMRARPSLLRQHMSMPGFSCHCALKDGCASSSPAHKGHIESHKTMSVAAAVLPAIAPGHLSGDAHHEASAPLCHVATALLCRRCTARGRRGVSRLVYSRRRPWTGRLDLCSETPRW
jgi:hypothetical protein